jgi:ribosomal protein S18 acetylase RimI-like enzyme
MTTPPIVRPAREDESECVAATLHQAFAEEAGLNYWLRQGARKEAARRAFFAAAVREAVHSERKLWLAETEHGAVGAAIWLNAGDKAYDFTVLQHVRLAPLLWTIAGASGALRGLQLGERLNALHPREPHAHLVFLGVAPQAQGLGVGSAMLKITLAPLDAARVPALLEATSERNVALYRRYGFEVIENFHVRDLDVRIMWRAPRGIFPASGGVSQAAPTCRRM